MNPGTIKTDSPLDVFLKVLKEDKYLEHITKAVKDNKKSIVIDYEDVLNINPNIARAIIEKPEEMMIPGLNALRLVMVDLELTTSPKPISELLPPELKLIKIPIRHIRYSNVEEISLKDIRGEYVNKLVTVRGIVRSSGRLSGKPYQYTYKCPNHRDIPPVQKLADDPVPICTKDNCNTKMDIVSKDTVWEDILTIQIQEPPETAKSSNPKRIKATLEGDIAREEIEAGDILKITGMVATERVKNRDEYYIKGINIDLEDKKYEEIEMTEEDIQAIQDLAKLPPEVLEQKIINTIAPRIQGYKEVKEAIALQLFGGVSGSRIDNAHIRGDIHILLLGDPGIGKSDTLNYISDNLAPRSIYTDGKLSSGVGLTAITSMKEGDEWEVEAGAMVLADKGLCIIDEFDKMKDEERDNLNTPLEQQKVHIAKASGMITLNSRCSVLLGANPKGGRLTDKPIREQISFPDTILSRMDLIFILKDVPNTKMDGVIADVIIDEDIEEEVYKKGIDAELLRKYIAYARQNIHPRRIEDPEVKKALKEYYVDARQTTGKNGDEDSPIPISPRLIRALKRLTQARARMFLREDIIYEDGAKAIELLEYCQNTVGMDPFTGKVDLDIMEGRPGGSEKKFKSIVRMLMIEKTEEMGSISWYSHSGEHREEVIDAILEESRKEGLAKVTRKMAEEGLQEAVEWKYSYIKEGK